MPAGGVACVGRNEGLRGVPRAPFSETASRVWIIAILIVDRRYVGPESTAPVGNQPTEGATESASAARSGSHAEHPALSLKKGFNLAQDNKLRGCDVVALRVDVVAPSGCAMDRAIIRQEKTGRPVRFAITDQTRLAVDGYLRLTGRIPASTCLRVDLDQAAEAVRPARTRVSGQHRHRSHQVRHSLAPPYEGCSDLPAHRQSQCSPAPAWAFKIKSTVVYLGIEADDAIEIAGKIDI